MKQYLSSNAMRRTVARLGLLSLGAVLSGAAFAQTDITFGGDARAFAMGGAGIAITQKDSGGTRPNPASLAFERRGFDFRIPTFAVRTDNDISFSRVVSYFVDGQLKNQAENSKIAREFNGNDSNFAFNGSTSVRFSNFEVGGFAVAKGKLQPNTALRNWISAGRPTTLVPDDSRVDVIGAGYTNLPAIAAGFILPTAPKSRHAYSAGLRVKVMRAYYAHYVADADALNGDTDSFTAPELGDKSYLEKRGIGADLGFLMQPGPGRKGGLSAGFVIANALNPGFNFAGTDRDGNSTTLKLLRTTASAGVGYSYAGITLVGDWVDITGSSGPMQLRLGGEVAFPLKLAVRAGYSSANGFTYGAGIFGFDIAFAERQPLEVVKTIEF